MRRRSIDAPGNPSVAQRIGREMGVAAIDPLAVNECIVRSSGDRVRVAGIPVIEIPVIVHVVKIVEVVEVGVIHVHVIPVAWTTVIPGTERLSPTEREPAIAAAPTEAEANADAKSTAEESDKRRTVVGRCVDRTRAPAPIGAEIVPTTIVIGCKTPRFITDPGPTPWRYVRPVAVAMGAQSGDTLFGTQ